MKDLEFYVYALIDPRNNQYFYIGKGKEKRYTSHFEKRKNTDNSLKDDRIREIEIQGNKVQIQLLFTNLDEQTAYDLEKIIIYKLGRISFSEGILTNLVPGGKWNRDDSVFYSKSFNESFDLSKLSTKEQKTFLAIQKISQFNYLNISKEEQIIYMYENNGTFKMAIPLKDFFEGGVTHQRIEILKVLRENELPIYYGYIYSKHLFKNVYLSEIIPYSILDIIDSDFNKKFDKLNVSINNFSIESKVNGTKRAEIVRDGNIISFTSFYKSGTKRYFRKLSGKQTIGISYDWYENGNIQNEKKHSVSGYLDYENSFYENGTKESEIIYTNDNAMDRHWHRNGMLASKFVENIGTIFYNDKGIKTRIIWLEGHQPDKQIEIDFDIDN